MTLFNGGVSTAAADLTPVPRRPYVDPFLAHFHERLTVAGDEPLAFDEATWDERPGEPVGCDVESYENLFLVCFKRFSDGKRLTFELSRRSRLDRDRLISVMRTYRIVTFNGSSYDVPMIRLALTGADTVRLKQATQLIVESNLKPWQVEAAIGVMSGNALDHVDLMESNPSVRQGLKMLGARLHTRFLVDLPYPSDVHLSPREMNVVTLYCHYGDLDSTQLVFDAMREPLALREALSAQYKMNLLNRSDAQIGEAIVRYGVERSIGRRLPRSNGPMKVDPFRYRPPSYLRYESEVMRDVLRGVAAAEFTVGLTDKIETPGFLRDLTVKIGQTTYSMGIGGLHSMEAHRALYSDPDRVLIDVDMASQYPRLILTLGLYPKALGPIFLDVYGRIVDERLAAKAAGDKVRTDGLKIAVNGVYGKLGSPYSCLYAPHLLIATTLTGQLSILMLIERAEAAGIPVVSANTDGVVFHCPRTHLEVLERVLGRWAAETGMTPEETRYRAMYNASVNGYLAINEAGKVKRKGLVADPWRDGDPRGMMQKNPSMTILGEAVLRLVADGIPLETTIRGCDDPRSFVQVIKVAGGAVWRGVDLGRLVRYYWSRDGDEIWYADGRRRVARTTGARPLVELIDAMPPDVDWLRYCEAAVELSAQLGVRP